MSEPTRHNQELSVVEALPGLARVAADAWMRTAWWGLSTSLRLGTRVARAALDPNSARQLARDFSTGMRGYAREFLGISDLDDRVRDMAPAGGTLSRRGRRNGAEPDADSLRVQGAELLRAAAEVAVEDDAHPAYARILAELAPDEARILRVLIVEGPQPMVDVRAANLIGVGSQLVAPRLNMLDAEAGLRHRDRVPAFLNNLSRLNLIRLSDEALDDPSSYQVLEAQPDVLDAIKQTSRAKPVRRSIHLTPFGEDFCRVCLPTETSEVESLTAEESTSE